MEVNINENLVNYRGSISLLGVTTADAPLVLSFTITTF